MKLTDFKVLTFDVIGTLIDFETGLLRAVRSLGGPKAAAASDDDIFEPYKRGRDRFYGRSSVAMKDVYLHVAGEMGFATTRRRRMLFSWPCCAGRPSPIP